MGRRRVGLWLVGALGNIGATVALGLAALRQGLIDHTGLVTSLPEFAGLNLDEPAEIEIGGHEIRSGDFASTAGMVGGHRPVFSAQQIEKCRPYLDQWTQQVRPGGSVNSDIASARLANRPDLPPNEMVQECIMRLQTDISTFARQLQLSQVVVINIASTEPPANAESDFLTADDLRRGIERNHAQLLPMSSWIAYAAIDAGYPYVNFTASAGADIPVLAAFACERRVPIAGSDGKTGETLVRTVLAPMFRQRNLRVLSWVGHNLLGNRDGQILSEPPNRESKLRAKDQVLASLLGYSPQTMTSINQVDSLDDWKTAWDHVHFQGFLGVPMTMQFTWQGCDSALAAPLVLDLARLTLAAQRHDRVGCVDELSVFFKRPMGQVPHDLACQFELLKAFANKLYHQP